MLFSLINFKVTLLIIAGGFLPAFLWLWFWLKEDKKNPEPKLMILATFIAGGLSVFAAFYLERETAGSIDSVSLENARISFTPFWDGLKAAYPLIALFLGWGLIEEFVKYLAATIAAFTNKNFNEPVDGMIYMITAALGFAAVENSLFLLKVIREGSGGYNFLITGNLRFLGANLLHIFCSAVIGAIIGLSFQIKGIKKIFRIIVGILIATMLHALFNFFIIINDGENQVKVIIILWALIVALIVLFEKIKKIKLSYV